MLFFTSVAPSASANPTLDGRAKRPQHPAIGLRRSSVKDNRWEPQIPPLSGHFGKQLSELAGCQSQSLQLEIRMPDGQLLTVPDFAYSDRRLAIYCDGFVYHGNADSLAADARKRNALQTMGWAVLTFWGRQILRDPSACEEQVWRCYLQRETFGAKAS